MLWRLDVNVVTTCNDVFDLMIDGHDKCLMLWFMFIMNYHDMCIDGTSPWRMRFHNIYDINCLLIFMMTCDVYMIMYIILMMMMILKRSIKGKYYTKTTFVDWIFCTYGKDYLWMPLDSVISNVLNIYTFFISSNNVRTH